MFANRGDADCVPGVEREINGDRYLNLEFFAIIDLFCR